MNATTSTYINIKNELDNELRLELKLHASIDLA